MRRGDVAPAQIAGTTTREKSTASIARRRRRRGGSDDGDAQCTLPVDISEVEKFEKYVSA